MDAFDLSRAQAVDGRVHPVVRRPAGLVPYQGNCQIHRARIYAISGRMAHAFDAAQDAYRRLFANRLRSRRLGAALYQLAELHRLRGEFTEARDTYLQASRWVRDPQPGLALLLLEQGRTEAAVAAIRRSLPKQRLRQSVPGFLAVPWRSCWRRLTFPARGPQPKNCVRGPGRWEVNGWMRRQRTVGGSAASCGAGIRGGFGGGQAGMVSLAAAGRAL